MALIPQLKSLLAGGVKKPRAVAMPSVSEGKETPLDFLPRMPQERAGIRSVGGFPVVVKPSRNKRLPKDKGLVAPKNAKVK